MKLIIQALQNMSDSLNKTIQKPAAAEAIQAAKACLSIIDRDDVNPVQKIHQLREYCRSVSYVDNPVGYAITRQVMARISAVIEEIERNIKPPMIGVIHPRRRYR